MMALLLPLLFFLLTPVAQANNDAEQSGSQPETEEQEEDNGGGGGGGLRIVPPCATGRGIPGLDCVLLTLGNIAQLILALTGGLALLMFVYGGFLLLTSGGSETRVSKGKDTLKAAITGIVIILLAGYLIRWGLGSLGVDTESFAEKGAESEVENPDMEFTTEETEEGEEPEEDDESSDG